MAETFAFGVGVLGILYVVYWLWHNDDGDEQFKKKVFSPHEKPEDRGKRPR